MESRWHNHLQPYRKPSWALARERADCCWFWRWREGPQMRQGHRSCHFWNLLNSSSDVSGKGLVLCFRKFFVLLLFLKSSWSCFHMEDGIWGILYLCSRAMVTWVSYLAPEETLFPFKVGALLWHGNAKPLILTFTKLDMLPALAGFGMPFYNRKDVADLFGGRWRASNVGLSYCRDALNPLLNLRITPFQL